MMESFAVCIALVTLVPSAYAHFGDDMTYTIQRCCDESQRFASIHSVEDCQGYIPLTFDVSESFKTMCTMASAQCCKEYFDKKNSCDSGIDTSISSNSCGSTSDTSKICCDNCAKGSALGASNGPAACQKSSQGSSPEEMLADGAFVKCCEKAAKDWKESSSQRSSNTITLSTMPSTCEEYAPNELCAHHCIPVPGSYRCECNPGFMLMADGRNCKKVTKNRCKPHNHCQHKCNDNGVHVKCSCRRGYALMDDGKSCQDIDECSLDVPVCLSGTKCHNIKGSYRCLPLKKGPVERGQCPPGFTRNVHNSACDDINECLDPNPPCPSYVCENTIGSYKCAEDAGGPDEESSVPRPGDEDQCPQGFKIGSNGECEDVDECEALQHDCNPLSQHCINKHGSFFCQDMASHHCLPGYKINEATYKCEDINECEEDGSLCRPDEVCVNQLGQYDCKSKVESGWSAGCPSGTRKKDGTPYCEDIDECSEGDHVCDLNQVCINTHGGYDCHCKSGYELDVTTGACVDVNECATGQNECMPQVQRCDNTVGSYICVRIASCGTGYVLQHSTGKCEDIDECGLGIHNCGTEHSCVNMRGSFRCVRRTTTTSSTTTSTTPDPEYEYYYDSEEEIDNSTSSNTGNETPKETTTTSTTTKPESPITEKSTQATPVKPEANQPDIHYTEPKETDQPEPSPTLLVIPKPPELPPKPTVPPPKPTIPVPEPPTERQPLPEERPTEWQPSLPEVRPTERQPSFPEARPTYWLPYQPRPTERQPQPSRRPEIPPEIPEDELPREPDVQITPYYSPETNPSETERQPEVNTFYNYTNVPTEVHNPSSTFLVTVGEETTDAGEKKEDESAQEIPKTEWPKHSCPLGFEPDENGACFDVDECAANRHSCSGLTEVCRNTIGGYTCNCASGFRRDLVTKACDVVTTSSSTTSTTARSPSSTNIFWGYPEYHVTARPFRPRNMCDAGYHYNTKTMICEDINECTNGQANCASVEICINTEGGYKCECPPNWRLDEIRHRCVPNSHYGHHIPPGYGNQPVYPTVPPKVNVPLSPGTQFVDPDITQIEDDRGSIFRCPNGYRLGDDNTCIDVNECLTGEAKCGPIQICTNLPGGYSCNCPPGHKLISDHQCEDVDECAVAGSLPVCSQNADCMNTIGSYQCKCHTGFRSAPVNDKVCVDVDECMAARAGTLCQHRCNNVWGGYRCSCHRGYRLNADNNTCSDINECQEFKAKIPCVGRCVNEPGSYRCTCPKGYKLSEDKRSCIDIDECETGEAPCASSIPSITSNDQCVNTRGGYKCHRITCPVGYRLENKHRCTQIGRVCQPGDWNCTRQPTTISYNFITFVSSLYIPDGELKLFTMKGPAWTNAKMRFELRLVDVNAPPSVKKKADINDFLLTQKTNFEGLMSLVRPLEGPQSIELEMSMDVYTDEHFGGTAVAKLFIYVSEYEF